MKVAAEIGAQVHVVHLACAKALHEVLLARWGGVRVTAETCPHYLAFTVGDLERVGPLLKTAPVVKTESDRQVLRQALASGDLDLVATDHAPGAWPEDYATGSFWITSVLYI